MTPAAHCADALARRSEPPALSSKHYCHRLEVGMRDPLRADCERWLYQQSATRPVFSKVAPVAAGWNYWAVRVAKPVIATVVTCREFFRGQSHIGTSATANRAAVPGKGDKGHSTQTIRSP